VSDRAVSGGVGNVSGKSGQRKLNPRAGIRHAFAQIGIARLTVGKRRFQTSVFVDQPAHIGKQSIDLLAEKLHVLFHARMLGSEEEGVKLTRSESPGKPSGTIAAGWH